MLKSWNLDNTSSWSWKVTSNESFKVCCRCLQMSSILVRVENYAVALHTVGVPPPPPLPRLFRERQQIHICHIWISAVAPSTTCHLNEARKSNGLASSSLATTEQMNTYRDEQNLNLLKRLAYHSLHLIFFPHPGIYF